ncbi:MAG: SDR family NAD(P)-dependent oxidoreductase [Candidatus Marinimicrobia bacterium]|nr:SDR family NAD(P)-dependent oxidoreductase [Candidatus Neomarinimicrobiota bacterium]MCF7828360.1 SDR family NAD(P)-dependent oxidoreductase [Candidatus Neomarinimicrobiota bacterium]MCF7881047.1 SDR family NAD(P)-dependent oxidoreductase [Candidatus Neomarinimicrobiota bacterium]
MNIALVTGASSGLGWEFARQIDSDFSLDEIWLVARRKDRLHELASGLKTAAKVFPLDLREPECLQYLGDGLAENQPHLRLLVNNAGFGKRGRFSDIPLAPQLDMIDLNIRALVHLTYLGLEYMDAGDRIIQVASSAGFLPMGNFATYSSTKAFIINFSTALGAELHERGITVTAVCPGPVDTEFQSVAGSKDRPQLINATAQDVVTKAMQDLKRSRSFSIYGFIVKLVPVLARIAPRTWLAKLNIE